MTDRKVFTLRQLSEALRARIEAATQGSAFWVKAEIAGINAQRHIYLELVQHAEGTRVAVMRGIIWQHWMRGIRETLGDELPNILKEGAEIMFSARVSYHPVYGLALHIEAVDLSWSLGELERRKQSTIATLRAEGLYDLNRSLSEPMVPQRIALVASIGSAAHGDFMRHLAANEHGYRFHVHEYPSIVQGEGAARELRLTLERIDPTRYDAVVMIRGGGSRLDLEAFNDLELCRAVARMPIPVMTGIGHDVDVSVVDLIARSPHKTPTAIADHLVDKCLFFETGLSGSLARIQRAVHEEFSARNERMVMLVEMLRSRPVASCQRERAVLHMRIGHFARHVTNAIATSRSTLDHRISDLGTLPLRRLKEHEAPRLREWRMAMDRIARIGLRTLQQRMAGMHDAIRLLDPEKALARGFTITRHHGKALVDTGDLQPGDIIETRYRSGKTISTVNSIEGHA